MSLAIFSAKNQYWKNGYFWWSRIINKVIGETRYDYLRVQKRIFSNRFYYSRQQLLYEMYVDYNEWAQLCGVYCKTDQSHGFPTPLSAEMYRDFQENTINTDGWFGMAILYIAIVYLVHVCYNYMIPYYWIASAVKNGENVRLRMKDCIATTVLEELYGMQYMEWGFAPHDFAYQRRRLVMGYSNPDDPRIMHFSTFNRKHKYREAYLEGRIGDMTHMTSVSINQA